MTSVARWTGSMSQAVVADLPVPVAPSSTVSVSPARTRFASSAIAAGWSPLGVYSEMTSKGATVRCRSVVGRMAQPYVRGPTAPTRLLLPDVGRPQLDGVTRPGELHGELLGPLLRGDVEQEEPGEVLLGLGVRPVGGDGAARVPPVEAGGRGVAERLTTLELAARGQLLQHRVEGGTTAVALLLRPGEGLGHEVARRVAPGLRVRVDEDDVLHGSVPSVRERPVCRLGGDVGAVSAVSTSRHPVGPLRRRELRVDEAPGLGELGLGVVRRRAAVAARERRGERVEDRLA